MKEIIVNYDESTGNVSNFNGIFIGLIPIHEEVKESKSAENNLLDLVKHGLTAEDLIKLKTHDIL